MGTTRKVTITHDVEVTVDDDFNITISDLGTFNPKELKTLAKRDDLKPIYIAMYEAGLEVYQQVASARSLLKARTGAVFMVELNEALPDIAIVVRSAGVTGLRFVHQHRFLWINPDEMTHVKSAFRVKQPEVGAFIEANRPTANDEARQ